MVSLPAGIIFGLVHHDKKIGRQFQLFFAACVAIAGIVGALTAGIKIFFIQTFPAVLAVFFIHIKQRQALQ